MALVPLDLSAFKMRQWSGISVTTHLPRSAEPGSERAMDRWMPMLLGLRLRQLEKMCPTYGEFAEAAGLSRGTLYHLHPGRANLTFQIIATLAASLGVSV
ncbi:helix-turn-helix transcriptional regulator (plasmid) [Rhizobium sp. CB3171]|uniref:helix-turn-helix domain-containing protein n=1 Tax=Rhizobium sp. CB3171 TaxID=3039157 RepID=UPI0024B0CD64|nr:helix-turn-helix transcriptional regulator [Rhizobium sp. CB3171]WFU07195.1 helix-turn-helix transcriptional regulator [Rhizobium sp. CB3171]